ncbi:hypothetical protein PsYK624_143800 [Phanerochaete sordida]|uniref:Heterokaryon incompatibility domain-containing protein n=1 Tax=Phanerochaete sordida TaxID=48140 RepID=A0A9P3LK55_9APHY|nr:hypothetical protein PsYK624_143800 [Phanerochaete sordida]
MFPAILSRRRQKDLDMREQASHEHYINSSSISPRRVWDLYSNRVLPYYALPPHPSTHIPHNVWTVSHSWLDEADRTPVLTAINGNAWPVPLPRGTSLDHIRVELLNMGAEYVWLDVLCLRQRGRPEDEAVRIEEWRLDIPTIGHTYSLLDVPCVTYFNGLGLPFDPSSTALKSKRHWLNRVWALQETTTCWLPGGATGAVSPAVTSFFHNHWGLIVCFGDVWELVRAIAELQRRHCDNELDRISALAYTVRCRTLPVYSEQQPLEDAWAILIKHLPPYIRGLIFLRSVEEHPSQLALWPSWAQFLKLDVSWHPKAWTTRGAEPIYLVHDALLETASEGQYYQRLYSMGVYRMERLASVGTAGSRNFTIRSRDGSVRVHETRGVVGGRISAGRDYLLLKLIDRVWLAVLRVGGGNVRGEKVEALEVIKEGCIVFRSPPPELPGQDIVVTYRSVDVGVRD